MIEEDAQSEREPASEQAADGRREARESRSTGGGKLNRSETVTVRLDPKLNYLCELAARAQRRTKSSFIEWAVDEAMAQVPVAGTGFGDKRETIANLAGRLWDVDEADRLIALAEHAPFLMTHEEQLIWKVILGNGYFWFGHYDDDDNWVYTIRPGGAASENIRMHWAKIKEVALEGAAPWDLPMVTKKSTGVKSPPGSDIALDDDLPF